MKRSYQTKKLNMKLQDKKSRSGTDKTQQNHESFAGKKRKPYIYPRQNKEVKKIWNEKS